MTNKVHLLLCLLLAASTLSAQEKLKVIGDARVDGVLKLIKGNDNTIIGLNAGTALTTGSDNTFLGEKAGFSATTAQDNVFLGNDSGRNTAEGASNVFVGGDAGASNTSGSNNTFIGRVAGFNNTDRSGLVAIGDSALYHNGLGTVQSHQSKYNTAIGSRALFSNTKGDGNTANGSQALYSNKSGFLNTANGYLASYSNTKGILNTANGVYALYSNTIGDLNTANGVYALYSNTSGDFNTANGNAALDVNRFGNFNTASGSKANVTTTGLEYATAIGSNTLTNANEKTVIGRNEPGVVIGGYAAWSNLSDGRFKEGVQTNVPGLEFIRRLRPVTYWVNVEKLQRHITAQMPDTVAARYLPRKEVLAKAKQETRTGFVAQEVEASAREIGYNFDGVNAPKNPTDNYSIAYSQFVPSLVQATQEQQELLEEQDRKISNLQQENRQLRKELAEIRQLLDRMPAAEGPSGSDQTIQLKGAQLLQNSPNPFSRSTFIDYFLPEGTAKAQLRITDMTGRMLQEETISQAGEGRLQLRPQSLAPGTYAYSLLVNGQVVETKQMVITK